MKILKWILKHAGLIIFYSIVYMLLFHIKALNFTHIYFYDGILRLLCLIPVIITTEIVARRLVGFDYKDIVLSVAVFVLINALWLSLCVVSLDRSLSVFLLCYMNEQEKAVPKDEIEQYFDKVFVEKYGMLERRFDEQIASGNMEYSSEDNGYHLTKRGVLFVKIFKSVGDLYNVDTRFTDPE